MAARCGVDIVEIQRFQRWIERSHTEQLKEIFTDAEWDYCQKKPSPLLSLAARFAIKEACMKLFPAETNRVELNFNDIEVAMDHHGAPYIHLNEKLQQFLDRHQLRQINISISHTENYACGMAVAE